MFRRFPLSRQLIILFGLTITLSIILSTGFALFRQNQELRRIFEDRGKILSDSTATFLFTPLYFNDIDNVQDIIDSLIENEGVVFAIAQRADGAILSQSGDVTSISDDVRVRVSAFACVHECL